MKAAEAGNREALETWLRDRPREVAVAVALRAALRIMPMIVRFAPRANSPEHFEDIVASVFRGFAIARVALVHPSFVPVLHTAAAAAGAAVRFSANTVGVFTHINGPNPGRAAAEAVAAENWTLRAFGSHSHAEAINATTEALLASARPEFTSGDAFAEIESDFRNAEEHESQSLLARPLWSGEPPDWAIKAWNGLVERLHEGQNWQVWIDWYEARLKGVEGPEVAEHAYARVPVEVWEQGTGVANAWIAEQLTTEHQPRRSDPALLVFFSYAWQPVPAQHKAQIALFDRLVPLVNQKPPRYADLPRIELWRDQQRLEHSHGAEAQIAIECDRAFLMLALVSRKYPTSGGCMGEFDRFVDADGGNRSSKQAIVVAVDCGRQDVDRRFSHGLRLWMTDEEGRTLVEAINSREPAKDAFARKVAEQIWRAAERHIAGDDAAGPQKLASPKAKRSRKARRSVEDKLASVTYLPATHELRVNVAGRIGVDDSAPLTRDASRADREAREDQAEACRRIAEAVADSVEQGHADKFCDEYLVDRLRRYADCVPTPNNTGNIVLANFWADGLRAELAENGASWPKRVTREVRGVVDCLDKLNPKYPVAEAAEGFVEEARTMPPVAETELAAIPEALGAKPTSDAFEPEIAEALSQSLAARPVDESAPRGAREYQILTMLNRLVRALDVGAKLNGTISLARQILLPLIENFLDKWMPHWPF